MFSSSICGGSRVWLILLCLANLNVSRGDVGFESIQANFKLLQEQIMQLSDFVRNNSVLMNSKLETTISQLTEVLQTNAELTKQQAETKTSLLTNVVEQNHVSVLSQITEQQQILVKLTETVTNPEQSTKNVQNTASEILTLVSWCQIEHNVLVSRTDSAGSGWIVIQQRVDNLYDFDRTWVEYRNGFGNVEPNSSFWWGLERVHQLTKASGYELLLEMKNGSGEYRFARYSEFEIAGESDKYRLTKLGEYSGTAGDVNTLKSRYIPTGQQFSTKDIDNDSMPLGSCVDDFEYGGGWWYNACGDGLNERGGGRWSPWDEDGRLTYTRMLIRPKS